MDGTSMAAPHVAGAAALLSAAFPNESASQIRWRILNRARNIGVPTYWRYGVLDVWNAYHNVYNMLPEGNVGSAYYHRLSAGGTTWSLTGGSLPPGLSLHSDGLIFGLATTPGIFGFTVTSFPSHTMTLGIRINPNPSGVMLTGGAIQTTSGTHVDGSITVIPMPGEFIRFIPYPHNAMINSVEWESDDVPLVYPNQIESLVDYHGGNSTNCIWVTVNEAVTVGISITIHTP